MRFGYLTPSVRAAHFQTLSMSFCGSTVKRIRTLSLQCKSACTGAPAHRRTDLDRQRARLPVTPTLSG